MCKSMDSSYKVLSTGCSMISDVFPLCLMSVIHGLSQTIWQSPSKLQREKPFPLLEEQKLVLLSRFTAENSWILLVKCTFIQFILIHNRICTILLPWRKLRTTSTRATGILKWQGGAPTTVAKPEQTKSVKDAPKAMPMTQLQPNMCKVSRQICLSWNHNIFKS